MIKSPYRFIIGGLVLWIHFAAGLNFQAISPVLPLITERYDISHTLAGLLVSVSAIMVGFLGLPAAVLVTRLDLKRVYTFGAFLIGLLTLLALSPGFDGLLALRIAYGLGLATLIPATAPLLMQWFGPKERPIMISLDIAAMTLGMTASLAAAAPLASSLGWQGVLGSFGGVGLAGAFAWLFWGRLRASVGDSGASMPWRDIVPVLRDRTVFLLGLADAAVFGLFVVLMGWLPTFYNETRDMSLTEAGFITSLLPLMGVVAVLLGGVLHTRMGSKRLVLIVPGAMAGLGGLGSFLIETTAITYLAVIVVGLSAHVYLPTLLALPMELPGMTEQRVTIAWGWIMTASGTGAFLAPLVVGAMRDSFDSFVPGFLLFVVLAWFMVVAGFILPDTGRHGSRPPGPAASTAAVRE